MKSSSLTGAAAILLCAAALLSCRSLEPTYLDVGPEQLEAIAAYLGTDVEGMFTTHRARLKRELSEELGMTVTRLFEDEDLDGRIDALQEELPAELRTIVAEIRPAAEDAAGAAIERAAEDVTDPTNWVAGGLAGAGVIAAGLLGLRGRRKRRKAARNAKA